MSLKGFHIVFVIACTLLAIFISVWAFQQFSAKQETIYLISAIFSIFAGIGTVIYGFVFYKKINV